MLGFLGRERSHAPAEPGDAVVAPSPGIESPPVAPRRVEPAAERPAAELIVRDLRRTLEARCDVLFRTTSGRGDAALVIDRLRGLDESGVRQPPFAAQRALAVARDPRSGTHELAAVFEQDPALTEALLRMGNSTHYRAGRDPCLSIRDAVQRVGVRGVEMIVTVHMVEGLLCKPGSAYAGLLERVWSHMTRTAPVARSLAPAFGIPAETAFTVGLLHDVGKLVLFDHLSRIRAEHRREIAIPEHFLLDLLDRLHEPIGGMAATRWELGDEAVLAIGTHHREPPPETTTPLGELLCLSERVDHAIRTRKPLDLDRLRAEAELTTDASVIRERLEGIDGLVLDTARGEGHAETVAEPDAEDRAA